MNVCAVPDASAFAVIVICVDESTDWISVPVGTRVPFVVGPFAESVTYIPA